jgi:hypothetical protein
LHRYWRHNKPAAEAVVVEVGGVWVSWLLSLVVVVVVVAAGAVQDEVQGVAHRLAHTHRCCNSVSRGLW